MIGFVVDQNPFSVFLEGTVDNSLYHGSCIRINPHRELGFTLDLIAFQHSLAQFALKKGNHTFESNQFSLFRSDDTFRSHAKGFLPDNSTNIGILSTQSIEIDQTNKTVCDRSDIDGLYLFLFEEGRTGRCRAQAEGSDGFLGLSLILNGFFAVIIRQHTRLLGKRSHAGFQRS